MGRADNRFLARFVLCFALLAVMDLGAGAPDRPTAPAACDLLSRPEIERIVSAGLSQGEPRVQAGAATMCRFTGKRGGVVTILIRRIPGEDWVSRQIERMSRNWPTFREVPGIGDRSFLYDMKEAGAALCAFRGDYYIQVSVFRMGEASAVLPATEELAKRALAHIAAGCSELRHAGRWHTTPYVALNQP